MFRRHWSSCPKKNCIRVSKTNKKILNSKRFCIDLSFVMRDSQLDSLDRINFNAINLK